MERISYFFKRTEIKKNTIIFRLDAKCLHKTRTIPDFCLNLCCLNDNQC